MSKNCLLEDLLEVPTNLTFSKKRKNPLSLAGQRVSVELLSRFELETSSLPILPRLFSFTVPCPILLPGAVAAQWFRAHPSFSLTHLAVLLCIPIFGARMGFVWVSSLF